MKNFMRIAFALLFINLLSFNANAQNNSKEEAELLKMWDAVWQAYESGDESKMWSFYDKNACEVYPDGSSMCGLKAIIEGYEQFKTMLEGTPSWSMTKPEITFFGSDMALLMADVTADIKLKGGQQIGGKSKFSTIIRKVNGNWLIAFDSQTPVMEMPVSGN
ncbi:MAG: nuclear transport factor 2 family protein [Saprospiraceae bacterium]|nr:nuclear transport factor 2 family protein [Saprospiraceae bacterium]